MTSDDLPDQLRQMSVYELFVLKRAVHADLERRSRLRAAASNSDRRRDAFKAPSSTRSAGAVPAHTLPFVLKPDAARPPSAFPRLRR